MAAELGSKSLKRQKQLPLKAQDPSNGGGLESIRLTEVVLVKIEASVSGPKFRHSLWSNSMTVYITTSSMLMQAPSLARSLSLSLFTQADSNKASLSLLQGNCACTTLHGPLIQSWNFSFHTFCLLLGLYSLSLLAPLFKPLELFPPPQLLVSVFSPHSSSHLWNTDFILSFALQKNEKPTVALRRKHHLSRV